MKPKFYLFLVAFTFLLASCEKWVPDNNNYSRITGTWQLVAVDRLYSHGSEPVYSEYENGTFSFRSNESVEYSDYKGRMTGSWRLVNRSDGYYGPTNSLELRLYDYYGSRVIEWELYSVEIYSNSMVGYVNRFGNEYRYEFRRY
jgi:hypothetical protein